MGGWEYKTSEDDWDGQTLTSTPTIPRGWVGGGGRRGVGAAHALDDGAELPEGREEDLDLGGRELREPQAVDLLRVQHPENGGGPVGMAGEGGIL